MSRTNASLAVIAVALLAAPGAAALSRGQAERNVLRFVQKNWRHRSMPTLIDPQTHLLRDNTQAICRRIRGRAKGRFRCVVRPARHHRHEGLYVSYRGLTSGGFRVRWLFYRRR